MCSVGVRGREGERERETEERRGERAHWSRHEGEEEKSEEGWTEIVGGHCAERETVRG